MMLDLEPIKIREKAATKGPWHEEHSMIWPEHFVYADDAIGDELDCDADTAFVVHAREDIPALIAEVEMLRRSLPSEFPKRRPEGPTLEI